MGDKGGQEVRGTAKKRPIIMINDKVLRGYDQQMQLEWDRPVTTQTWVPLITRYYRGTWVLKTTFGRGQSRLEWSFPKGEYEKLKSGRALIQLWTHTDEPLYKDVVEGK